MTKKILKLSYEHIEARAANALHWFNPRHSRSPRATPIEAIVAKLDADGYLVCCYDVPLGVSERGNKILGLFLQKPFPTIFVDPGLAPGGRRFRFTLAHELGHFTFHRNLSLDFAGLDTPQADTKRELFLGRRNRTPRDWLEWQANAFASAILLPESLLKTALTEKQREMGIRRAGWIFVDDAWHNRQAHRVLLDHLQTIFDVSRTTLVIRLRQLGMLEDRRIRFQNRPAFALRRIDRIAA